MLAHRWQCSERHVRNLIRNGHLPAFKVGGKLLRVRAVDVIAFEDQAEACLPGASCHLHLMNRRELDGGYRGGDS
ncbi:helix-turn-helix domain-containing protein [Neorhizobium petrolearium]|uniref:helix-turn-helix domain-containing protein n=1 Tax=Neorhizobium petrolearium TaxID=515361 RepID=UPI003F5CDC0D